MITNAIDFLKDDGKITIKYHPESNKISVEDNGAGINQDKLKHIFEPFFTTRDVGQGMGLGLYIVQGHINNLGWDIDVQSEEGSGTKFMIQIR